MSRTSEGMTDTVRWLTVNGDVGCERRTWRECGCEIVPSQCRLIDKRSHSRVGLLPLVAETSMTTRKGSRTGTPKKLDAKLCPWSSSPSPVLPRLSRSSFSSPDILYNRIRWLATLLRSGCASFMRGITSSMFSPGQTASRKLSLRMAPRKKQTIFDGASREKEDSM
jgi:hypothetical protein